MADWLKGLLQAGGSYFTGRLGGETAADVRRRQMAEEQLRAEQIRAAMEMARNQNARLDQAATREAQLHPYLLSQARSAATANERDVSDPGWADVAAAQRMWESERARATQVAAAANLAEVRNAPVLPTAQETGFWTRPARPDLPLPGTVAPLQLPQHQGPYGMQFDLRSQEPLAPATVAAMRAMPDTALAELAPYQAEFTGPEMQAWNTEMTRRGFAEPLSSVSLESPVPPEMLRPNIQGTIEQYVRQPGTVDRPAMEAALQQMSPEELVTLGTRLGGTISTGKTYGEAYVDVPTEAERAATELARQQAARDVREQEANIANIEAQAGQRDAQGALYDAQAAGQSLDNIITAAKASRAPDMADLALTIERAKATIETVKAWVAVGTQDAQAAQAFADLMLTRYEAAIKQRIAETGYYPTSRSESYSQSYSQSQSFSDPAWLQLQGEKFMEDVRQHDLDYALRQLDLSIRQQNADTAQAQATGVVPGGSGAAPLPPQPGAPGEGGQRPQ